VGYDPWVPSSPVFSRLLGADGVVLIVVIVYLFGPDLLAVLIANLQRRHYPHRTENLTRNWQFFKPA
jgi:hypothetical protein